MSGRLPLARNGAGLVGCLLAGMVCCLLAGVVG